MCLNRNKIAKQVLDQKQCKVKSSTQKRTDIKDTTKGSLFLFFEIILWLYATKLH
jgi:hypothetical protein